jgi:hypothetical protein
MTRALHSSSSAYSSHYGRSLFVSLRFKAFCKVGLLLQSGAVPEVISRWLEAAPGAPGGSWFPCSFLHLLRRPSQGGWRQFLGPLGVPGFSARSFTCFGGNLKVVGGSSKGPRKFLVSLLVPSPVSEVISRWLAAVPRAPDFLLSALLPGSGMRFSVLAGSLVKLLTASPFAPLLPFPPGSR